MLVVITTLLVLCYDLIVWVCWRGHATVSTVVGEWMARPWVGPVLTFALFFVAGHFLGMVPFPVASPQMQWRLVLAGAGVLAGFLLTASL